VNQAVPRVAALSHVIYASTAAPAFARDDFPALLQRAREKNARLSVTGMLLCTSDSFFQVLEGEDAVVDALYAQIEKDPRHCNVTRIIQEPIARRDFADWSMGVCEAELSQLDEMEGFGGLFASDTSLLHLLPGRAKKLLSAFASGRWRSRPRTA
jgi:hypothetical protein